jgi:hypothetical protein
MKKVKVGGERGRSAGSGATWGCCKGCSEWRPITIALSPQFSLKVRRSVSITENEASKF